MLATNRYRKLGDDLWGIEVADPHADAGSTVTVTLKDGRTKPVTLGSLMYSNGDLRMFAVAPKPQQARTSAPLCDMSAVASLFALAAARKNSLSVPAINETIHLYVAGPRAKMPGTINVVSRTRQSQDGRDHWYGRILEDGSFQQAGEVPAPIIERLREYAADPAGVAAAHGKHTKCCCFCSTSLSDPRSEAVGYGPTCAARFGLPWGEQ